MEEYVMAKKVMTTDEIVEQRVRELHKASSEWVSYINLAGNQCAYSDSILEKILDAAVSLESWYYRGAEATK